MGSDGSAPRPHVPSDQELVRRCIEGDPDAWRAFVARHSRLIGHVVASGLRSRIGRVPEDAVEDVCAETYASLLEDDRRRLRQFLWKSRLSTWLGAVALSCLGKHLRSKRLGNVSLDELEERGAARLTEETAAEGLDREERGRRVKEALAKLAERDRLVLQLLYFHEAKYPEVARLIGSSEANVYSIASRARERLAGVLQGEA